MAKREKKPRVEAMTDQEIQTALMVKEYCQGGQVLDFPCGYGYMSRHLQEEGYEVESADVVEGIFRFPEMPWKQADLDAAMPYEDERFDAVCCVAGLEHTESAYRTMREFRRVLKPGGWAFVQYPNFSTMLRRLRFLSSGRLTKHSPKVISDSAPKDDRGHIECLSLQQVRSVMATVELEMVHTHFFRHRSKTRFWTLPLWGAMKAFAALTPGRRRREGLTDALSHDMLYAGEVVLVARRPG